MSPPADVDRGKREGKCRLACLEQGGYMPRLLQEQKSIIEYQSFSIIPIQFTDFKGNSGLLQGFFAYMNK